MHTALVYAAVQLMHCLMCKTAAVTTAALLLLRSYCLSATCALSGCDAMSVLPVGATTVVSGAL